MAAYEDLSPKEQELATAIWARKTRPEIAVEMGISPLTVRAYLNRIYWKLDIKSPRKTADLVLIVERAKVAEAAK